MKFLVDAQLPRRLAYLLNEAGHDTLHTLDLPLLNRTPDREISRLSIDEQRIVITKDADFVNSFLVDKRPWKLLLISTGNIRNTELEVLLQSNIERIVRTFDSGSFIELTRNSVIVHA
jgi:predicted nuclease of predicted toxin-antitoxin system